MGIGCLAHARRKFHDLHVANKSELAAQALESIGALYGIERDLKDLPDQDRQRLRHEQARPIADALHRWMIAQRRKVPDGSGTAMALDYSLKRWAALTRYLDDGAVPIDNKREEAQGAGAQQRAVRELRQRAATVMSLIPSAKLNGNDP